MASGLAGQRYDLVVFGATGYTGQFVVEEVARTAEQEKSQGKVPLSWAIAGRSEKKLQDVLATAKKETGKLLHICTVDKLFLRGTNLCHEEIKKELL